MTITDQDVAGIGNVNPVGEASDFLAANAALELAGFAEDSDAMSFEVANVEIISWGKNPFTLRCFS